MTEVPMGERDYLDSLVSKHASLDQLILEEAKRPLPDNLLLTKLKREKLHIKEEITRLQHGRSIPTAAAG
jgi:hypothetical protein